MGSWDGQAGRAWRAGPEKAEAMALTHHGRRIALVGALLSVFLGVSLLAPAQPVAGWVAGQFNGAQETLLLSLTNQARAAAGLAPLRLDSGLRSIARWRSQDMAVRGYFAHEIPPRGETVFVYMQRKGVHYRKAAENIGWTNAPDNDATRYIQALFMESEAHRANILDSSWDSVGIGAFKGTDGVVRYTVLFMQSAKRPARAARPAALPTVMSPALTRARAIGALVLPSG